MVMLFKYFAIIMVSIQVVNNGDKWMNNIDLHKFLVESPSREKPYLCLSEGGVNIIRLAMHGHDCLLLDCHFSLKCSYSL